MNKRFLVTFLIIFLVAPLFSQSYLGKQHSIQLFQDGVTELSGLEGDLDKTADFFFNQDYNDIEKKAKSMGLDHETMNSTIYIDGKRFRMDMTSMGQNMSAIINFETRQLYSIMHDQKQYFVMDLDELKAMQAQVKENMAAQMENMKGMMENMPAEAREMMEKMSGQKKSIPPEITQTGKTKTIHGFACKEILVKREDSRERLWVTSEYPQLRDAFYEMTTAMPMMEEDQIQWDEIKEGWPVQTTSVSVKNGPMDGSVNITEVYSLKEAKHKPGTFDPPAGYTKKTMQDMMGGMQGYPE